MYSLKYKVAINQVSQNMIKVIFKSFVLSVLMIAQVHFAYAQTATLLPNAVQTFLDKNGNPLSSGTVTTYIPNTTTKKTTWQDSGQVTPWANPLSLNAAGHPPGDIGIYGNGSYRQVVKDKNGNLIWDQVTASTDGGGSSGSTIGDGLPVGTILPWSGLIAPANYQFTYGQALSRTSYPELFQAITKTQTITCVGGSPTLISIADTSFISVGTVLEASCVTGSPTVISKTSNTVTLSSNAIISTTLNGTFFPYGDGDGLTTFYAPDTRGYILSGRCNMGGSDCSNLNSTYFSSNSSNTPSSLNAKGGNQNVSLATLNLPPYTPSGSISTSVTLNTVASSVLWNSGAGTLGGIGAGSTYSVGPAITASAISAFTGTAGGGTSKPISLVQPTLTMNYIVKVTPDVNLNSTYGVAAIGGMTGIIACGANVVCAGNTISVNIPTNTGVTDIAGMVGSIACGDGITCATNTISALPNYSKYGIKCDGTTDDGPAFITAFNSLNGAPLYLPAGTCKISSTAFLNTTTTVANTLTVPGIKIIGQGRGVTTIDTSVANGYAIAANPDWAALHYSMFALTPATSGSLATNTYYIQTTVTNPSSTEINVSPAKSVSVTGPSGSVSMNLKPLNSGYCYNIYIGTTSTPANYATVAGNNAICLSGNQTISITAIGTAHSVPTTTKAIWQESLISNLSITDNSAAANANGVLWFRVGYSTMSNVYMKGLTGDGLDIPNWTGDNDGSFVVTVDNSKFDNIKKWCVNAAGNTLEFSNFTISNSAFNQCGTITTNTLVPITIGNISNANPGVVTTNVAHTFQTGDQIYISAPAGMSLPAGMYRVGTVLSGTTFNLVDINNSNMNTTSLGTYTANSANTQLVWRAPQLLGNGSGPSLSSGAVAWTGLIGNFINNGFTQNQNVNYYITEAGPNDNATFVSNDMENTAGVGLYVAYINNMTWNNGECLDTSAFGYTVACMQLGTGRGIGIIQNIQINNTKVRSDATIANGFQLLYGTGGSASNQNTVSINNTIWSAFSGLNKFVGFLGNPISQFWARFDGKTGAACTLKDSYNIASCVRNSTGNYTLTFSAPMIDSNYSITGSASNTGTGLGFIYVTSAANLTTTNITFSCANSSSTGQDCDIVNVQGFGNPK